MVTDVLTKQRNAS